MTNTPPVIWAQRKDKIFLTYCVENINNPTIDIEPNQIKFDGVAADKKPYKLDITLFKEINPEKSIKTVRDRYIELVLKKQEDDTEFWPHLTKEKQKYHWLKVDFEKWVDEDDEEEEASKFNEDMMNGLNLGGMGGMPGMGGMGGMPGMGGYDDFNFDAEDGEDGPLSDSDDEEPSEPPALDNEKAEEPK